MMANYILLRKKQVAEEMLQYSKMVSSFHHVQWRIPLDWSLAFTSVKRSKHEKGICMIVCREMKAGSVCTVSGSWPALPWYPFSQDVMSCSDCEFRLSVVFTCWCGLWFGEHSFLSVQSSDREKLHPRPKSCQDVPSVTPPSDSIKNI